MINTKRKPVPQMHLPLKRLALCLDCDECFEITDACPACGSETWTSLGRFLEWNSPDSVSRLLGGPDTGGRHLIVVSRDRLKIYEQLRRALAGNPTFQVILDRRHGERRRANAGATTDRRHRDRRAARAGSSPLRWSVLVVDLDQPK
jgi:hypothetical protein